VQRIKTILGRRRRLKTRPPKKRAAEWSLVVEEPVHNLTVFKVPCGYLTLKVYTKGEPVLRTEGVVHNAQALGCCRSLSPFPLIVSRLREILERFHQVLSSVEACFIDDGPLERLPLPAQLGATRVGGIDLNQARMRHVQAIGALSPSPRGFAASQLAGKVRSLTGPAKSEYGPRRAAYDLKKLRAQQLARRIEFTRRYEATPEGASSLGGVVGPSGQGDQTPARCGFSTLDRAPD
jgi:hypothetical protein